MFENTLRLLDSIKGQSTYRMDIKSDEDGYWDKECPNPECLSKFKVNVDDWINLYSEDEVHCPFCGHIESSDKWWTTEQIEQAKRQAVENIEARLGQALQKDAKVFNRTSPKGFITISMKYTGRTYAANLPAEALEEMQQKITCERCGARYAVIGSAFFCPCCGHNSARHTFNNTIEKVKSKINNLDNIRDAIAEYNKDDAERTYISLLESSVPDLVVAVQRLCECIYVQLPDAKALKRNVFQRLDEGDSLWEEICGKGYNNWLTHNEYELLKKCFQQRHLLQHQDGIIDVNYINKSGDSTYKVGQKLIIKEKDILQYTAIVEKLGQEIINLLGSEQ